MASRSVSRGQTGAAPHKGSGSSRFELLLTGAILASVAAVLPRILSETTDQSPLLIALTVAFALMCLATAHLASRLFRDLVSADAPRRAEALERQIFRERTSRLVRPRPEIQ